MSGLATSSIPTEQTLLRGQLLQEQGHIEDAQQCYIDILQKDPQHSMALHLFGISLYQQNRYTEAVYLLQLAQAQSPDNSALCSDLGVVYLACENYEAALACLDKAISLEPDLCAAWNNRGAVLEKLDRLQDAETCWRQVLSLQPRHQDGLLNLARLLREQGHYAQSLELLGTLQHYYPDDHTSWRETAKTLSQSGLHKQALHHIDQALHYAPHCTDSLTEKGLILRNLKRYEDALLCFQLVASLDPDSADADSNCGVILDDLLRHPQAHTCYQNALQKQPDHPDALFNLAVNQENQGLFAEAAQYYQQLTMLYPKHVTAWQGLGGVLLHQRKLNAALSCYRKALMLSPDNADLWHDCAIVLHDMQHFWLAFSCLYRALQLKPHFASAMNTQGMMLYEIHHYAEAEAAFLQAQQLAPEMPEIYCNQAYCQLIQGHLLLGWQLYEWRFHWPILQLQQRKWQALQWKGEPFLPNQTILLYAEQGYGDTIQFCRYVSLVAQRNVRVILEVQPALYRLLKDLPGVTQVIQRGDALPPHDWQCSLMSLPCAFATTLSTIPAAKGYLSAETQLNLDNQKPKIGVVWAGNPKHHNNRARSVPLQQFLPVFSHPCVDYLCLQPVISCKDKKWLTAPNIHFPIATGHDFADTAMLISQVDLVITVDSAVAHLAGAMGKEVWLLLAYNNDWRWLTERNDSPWYASTRLFRQSEPGRWPEVINSVNDALSKRYPFFPNQ